LDQSFLFFLSLAVVIVILLIIGLVFLLPKVMKSISGRGGGWTRLAERFTALSPPVGDLFKGQTIEVGRAFYRRCATVGVSEQGLYLEVNIPFSSRLKPLFIPWEMVKGLREGKLYWKKTAILSVGEPEIGTIGLFTDLFTLTRPYLKDLP
jgi:hypothetical protein